MPGIMQFATNNVLKPNSRLFLSCHAKVNNCWEALDFLRRHDIHDDRLFIILILSFSYQIKKLSELYYVYGIIVFKHQYFMKPTRQKLYCFLHVLRDVLISSFHFLKDKFLTFVCLSNVVRTFLNYTSDLTTLLLYIRFSGKRKTLGVWRPTVSVMQFIAVEYLTTSSKIPVSLLRTMTFLHI